MKSEPPTRSERPERLSAFVKGRRKRREFVLPNEADFR
jgi:hypothetical protein